jgi:hypothetical protein
MDTIKHLANKYSVARYELIKECDGDELQFYLYLKLYAINKHDCFPAFKTIQEDLNWSPGKITRVIKRMVQLERLRIGKKEKKTRGGKQLANIYDITWYDNLNNKGSHKTNTKVVRNQTTLLEQGSHKTGTEPLDTLTNRNITNRESLNKLNELKRKYPFKGMVESPQLRTKIQEEVSAIIRPSGIKR